MPCLSLRVTEGSVAISLVSMPFEIASVVSLPRKEVYDDQIEFTSLILPQYKHPPVGPDKG